MINPDSENSSESEEQRLPTKSTISTHIVDSKPVQLSDFVKIVVRRKELAKWHEHEEYRQGLRGTFVRVTYHK